MNAVLPSVPSATPVFDSVAANPAIFEVDAALNPWLSATWNSYVRAPVLSAVALRTRSVGRSVSSCSSFAGESSAGAVSVAETGVGALGVELPPQAAASSIDKGTYVLRCLTRILSGLVSCAGPLADARGRGL